MIELDLVCPFCDDTGFDKIGLKIHLLMFCDDFAHTPVTDDPSDIDAENENQTFSVHGG